MKRIFNLTLLILLFVVSLSCSSFAADNVIEINDVADYNSLSFNAGDSITIKGVGDNVKLNLPAQISLKNNLKIQNVVLSGECTMYANGYSLYIADDVTSTSRLTVYGGASGSSVKNTDIQLYGGLYKAVYGGGNNSAVTGSTSVIFGGNCNLGDDINDQNSETISPCYIYGGGNNGSVNISTKVIIEGNAVAKYVFGAGTGTGGTVTESNVYILGGKVMNVYGGSTNTALSGCNANIYMIDGVVESVFGASSQNSFTGNTYVTLLGGEVLRRVYTGCYNDWSLTWKSSYCVNGSTYLIIGTEVSLNTKNGLALTNQTNVGVFAGSRIKKSDAKNEINTILYVNGSYAKQKDKIGDKSALSFVFSSNAKFVAAIGNGGTVFAGETPGMLYCSPDLGKYVSVNGSYSDETVNLTENKTVEIEFSDDFAVNNVSVSFDGDLASVITVDLCCENVKNIDSPVLFVSVVDNKTGTKRIYTSVIQNINTMYSFESDLTDYADLNINAYVVNQLFAPLCKSYSYSVK